MNPALTTATTSTPAHVPALPIILRWPVFLGGYLIFALLGTSTSLLAFPFSFFFKGPRTHRFGQAFIRSLFRFFLGYLRVTGLARFDFEALNAFRNSQCLIFAANHPSLLDAVFVASEIPRVFCVMKASLSHSPVLCGTARLAGYVQNESGLGLVRQSVERMAEGANLLIFPEGTRTRGQRLNDFKMGFALIAKQAQAPVQTLLIDSHFGFLGKGWPLFKLPPLPMIFTIRAGKRFEPDPAMDVKEFGRSIEQYFDETVVASNRVRHEP
jgi:1-acyl-sn-glycerol-3-phosphate acyltransferase